MVKADDFLRGLQQEAEGIIAPRIQRESANRHLADHIEDDISDLRASGRDFGYLAAIYTGLRRGELKALEWGDFHSLPDFATASEKDATIDATDLDISRPEVSHDGTNEVDGEDAGKLIKSGFWRGLAQKDALSRESENGCLTRTRT